MGVSHPSRRQLLNMVPDPESELTVDRWSALVLVSDTNFTRFLLMGH
jgi:hypothetical protein